MNAIIKDGNWIQKRRWNKPMATIFIAASLSVVAAQSTPAAPAGAALPDGPGKSIVQRSCNACHALGVITSKRASPDQWSQVVNEMVSRGADLSDDEIDTLIQYLSTNFGPAEPKSEHSAPSGTATQPSPRGTAIQPGTSGAAPHVSAQPTQNRDKAGTQ
jgi:cytochrome c5